MTKPFLATDGQFRTRTMVLQYSVDDVMDDIREWHTGNERPPSTVELPSSLIGIDFETMEGLVGQWIVGHFSELEAIESGVEEARTKLGMNHSMHHYILRGMILRSCFYLLNEVAKPDVKINEWVFCKKAGYLYALLYYYNLALEEE